MFAVENFYNINAILHRQGNNEYIWLAHFPV